jgi:hypothetical protein
MNFTDEKPLSGPQNLGSFSGRKVISAEHIDLFEHDA